MYHKAKSQADATMAQRPAAPTLSATPSPQAVRIDFAVPTDGEIHAAVHLHDAGGAPRMYDAKTGTILPAGETGQVIVFKAGAAGRSLIVVATGLGVGTFTATVCFRRPCDFDWGPTSPRSAPLVRTPAPACGPPMLEPVSETEIRVYLAVPLGCSIARIFFCENEAPARRFVDKNTRTLTAQGDVHSGTIFPVTGEETIVVKGLSDNISYTVRVEAHNGIGWGPCSPASKPLKLADHQPPAPGKPVLERVSADSVRVFCALSPKCTHGDIFFKDVTTGVELSVDEQSGNKLREPGEGFAPTRDDCYKGLVALGVSPDTEYEVWCKQCSDFGWSDPSPSAMLPVPSRPAAPPPAIGRKRAVDADDTDDDDPPPAPRPIKQEKRKMAHGYDCTDGFCVDGDEDEPARGARTSTEDIFGEPDSDEGDQDDAAEQPAKRRKESPPGWAKVSL